MRNRVIKSGYNIPEEWEHYIERMDPAGRRCSKRWIEERRNSHFSFLRHSRKGEGFSSGVQEEKN